MSNITLSKEIITCTCFVFIFLASTISKICCFVASIFGLAGTPDKFMLE